MREMGRSLLGALAATAFWACFEDKKSGANPVATPEWFPTDVAGLAPVAPSVTLDLKDGDTVRLTAAPAKKVVRGREVRMLAYNGSIPGPLLRVPQGAEITVILTNRIGIPTLLHSHGVRMDAAFDGTMDVQDLIAPGDSFTYRIRFPDPGLFWYHPHFREDYAKELGLYGNFLVKPADTTYWAPVNREEMLMLDDFYLDTAEGGPRFRTQDVDRTMMGRFGNVFFVNGDTAYSLTVRRNEVVRFYATNSSNTRVFNLGLQGPGGIRPKLKVVGTDQGQYEWFDTVLTTLIAPSERRIFEVRLTEPGNYRLAHYILQSRYNNASTLFIGDIMVEPDSAEPDLGESFRLDTGSVRARRSIDSVRALTSLAIPPDKEILLTGTMGGMALMAAAPLAKTAQDGPISIEAKGIEWVDHMAEMNAISNLKNMKWVIRDLATGLENHAIHWSFKQGDMVKIRVRNDTAATHPMPHPIHFHGQRFLVAAVNGRRNLNMAWKDSYLVGLGETADLLLDASNPGTWMAQCHISEHFETMMMFKFTVE